MPVINILSPHVADMIAAGEVVERPGSVVKELTENSLDAGAENITIELRGGGATYIRVTDDGCGMAPEDAGNCFLRHATSKIQDERGLEAIQTMGFRGEALAAISAVSRVELLTRQAGDEAGTRVLIDGGDIQSMGSVGCPRGTTFTVRDLFYNTPARLKFMKSDRAEGAYCVQTALRVALGRPDVSVRCLKDGKEEFFTSGDGKPSSAVYGLLGREIALSMLPVEGGAEGLCVKGYVSSPAGGRGSRSMQFFYVNGRVVRSQLLQAAVEQAYKNTLLVGKFPACVLYITLNPGAVDVNVHPTKNEVKFSQEKQVFDGVYYAAVNALHGEKEATEMHISTGTKKFFAPAPPVGTEETPPPRKTVYPEAEDGEPWRAELHSTSVSYGTDEALPGCVSVSRRAPSPGTEERNASKKAGSALESVSGDISPTGEEPAAVFTEQTAKPAARLAGEVFQTYIVAEVGDKVLFIDKHAAHERINFDRLKAQGREIMSQNLITPEIWKPDREDRDVLEENFTVLADLGFGLEEFGADEFIVRSVPDALDPAQTIPALEEICVKLSRGGWDLARDEILQTISCRAAVKAGWDTDPREMQVLVDKVVCGEIKYCPHGRPVAITLTRKELDRQFKRIV